MFEAKSKILKVSATIMNIIGLVLIFSIIFGLLIMLLWNWLMPELFGLQKIDYWQAVGVFVLSKLLFGVNGQGSQKHKEIRDEVNDSKEVDRKLVSEFNQWLENKKANEK